MLSLLVAVGGCSLSDEMKESSYFGRDILGKNFNCDWENNFVH